MVWLVGQAASLSAFVPANCCVSHTETAATETAAAEGTAAETATTDDCHETEAPKPTPKPEPQPGDACPMQHDDGEACPMHRSAPAAPGGDCHISNTCEGPFSNLANLFHYIGTVERPASDDVTLHPSAAVATPPAAPLHHTPSPDAPPPKA